MVDAFVEALRIPTRYRHASAARVPGGSLILPVPEWEVLGATSNSKLGDAIDGIQL